MLEALRAGNARFRAGGPSVHVYGPQDFHGFAAGQRPRAAVVTCADSRIAPDVIFDQRLGTLLVARVPGNVASESVRWMLDIAVGELSVPLVLVVGHTGCRAVQQVIDDKPSARHAALQAGIHAALRVARQSGGDDLLTRTAAENARMTARELRESVAGIRVAVESGATVIVPALYFVENGAVELL